MKSLNLEVALILITVGIVLLIVSVSQYQAGQLTCTLTGDLCAQFAVQGARYAAIQFFEIALSEVDLMSIATVLLILGRNRDPRPTASPP